ncbi:hypothetical protein F0562_020514 [Nyssa sinensis]|uniref:cellulase n=1 Tax=Nyssa sinensis TaxID=561372 RepID=A0A5J5BST1_9ASTE|nr:hypothetical protein F0562_020514 [Nyssa sinensis]
MKPFSISLLFFLLSLLLSELPLLQSSNHDYADALSKSILFFEGQRSGFLPQDQRITWRANSGLGDGSTLNIDLTGGYYDAGDNIKFGFPMAFTTTMLAWSVIEFGDLMPAGELRNALVAIRWATDYLLKTVSQPNRIFVQVGDPNIDHSCWERPEDMDTARTVYTVEAPNPASDVAGETAAALAASSMAFRSSDPGYSDTLLRTATIVFEFADNYRGAYSDNSDIKDGACPFYCDFDGYQDELLWGAAWLRRASQGDSYLSYLQNNGKTLGADDNINEFGWDNKHAGLNVLVSKEVLEGSMYTLQSYRASADSFMCTLVPESSSSHIEYTPGGLIYKPGGSNLQHATTITFLLLVYANYLERSTAIDGNAMAVEDDMMESSVSSHILNSVESKQSGDVLSPDDVAWVDSCLIKDSEVSDSNWNSLKDALLEILSSQPESLDSSAAGIDGFSGETDIEILPSSEEAETSEELGRSISDIVLINEEAEENNDDRIINWKSDPLRSRTDLVNPFLPNYNEDLKQIEITDSGVDMGFPIFAMELATDDIFRLWDLDIPAEEDELTKQLNKALAQSSSQPIASTFDDSGVQKDLKEESLDDLISGIADLSLNQKSG